MSEFERFLELALPLSDARIERATPRTFAESRSRATYRGYATVHAYFSWRTKLRADYAASLALQARQPATYLPLMTAFRSATRTVTT